MLITPPFEGTDVIHLTREPHEYQQKTSAFAEAYIDTYYLEFSLKHLGETQSL